MERNNGVIHLTVAGTMVQVDAPNAHVAYTWLLSMLHLFEATSGSVGERAESGRRSGRHAGTLHNAVNGVSGLAISRAALTARRRRNSL